MELACKLNQASHKLDDTVPTVKNTVFVALSELMAMSGSVFIAAYLRKDFTIDVFFKVTGGDEENTYCWNIPGLCERDFKYFKFYPTLLEDLVLKLDYIEEDKQAYFPTCAGIMLNGEGYEMLNGVTVDNSSMRLFVDANLSQYPHMGFSYGGIPLLMNLSLMRKGPAPESLENSEYCF